MLSFSRTKAIAVGLLLGVLGLPGMAAAQNFVTVLVNPPPPGFLPPPLAVWYGDLAWGDYDIDGKFDLFITGNSRASFNNHTLFTQLYLHDADVFTTIPDPTGESEEGLRIPLGKYIDALPRNSPILEDVWQSSAEWGDADNDGDLDLLVTGLNAAGDPSLRVYENIEGFDRFAIQFTDAGVSMGDAAWGDYDNDGDLDFVVCGTDAQDAPTTRLYENQTRSGGGFVPRNAGLDDLAYCSVEWGDYDNDGDHDLLMTGIAEPQAFVTRIYRNDGSGTFSDAGVGLKRLLYASAAFGDYDADGDLDVLLSGAKLTPFFMEGELKVYRNDDGAFTDISDGLVGAFENDVTQGRFHGDVAWGDFTNDGYPDFVITGVRDPLSPETGEVYQNNRNDAFAKVNDLRFDGGLFGTVQWSDYDDDHDLDFIVLGHIPGEGLIIQIFRNEGPLSNTPPTVPNGLQATPQGNTVTLSWNPGSDFQTPTPGLTYNLRVGTTSGGFDVVSPMATASGYRLISRRGNAGHNTSWTLKNLPPGTYFWSVQALDNSFKGSPFAQEGTFTISTSKQASTR